MKVANVRYFNVYFFEVHLIPKTLIICKDRTFARRTDKY
jgi:hypothetical protein